MVAPRVIARLDIKNNLVIKGIHLEGIREVGDPKTLAIEYYEQGVDEIIYQDAVASLYGRNSLRDVIGQVAEKIFVPLCVGGGVRNIEDADELFRCGADKLAINTELVKHLKFATAVATKYGSQAVVGQIDAARRDAGWLVTTECGREFHSISAVSWAQSLESAGVGELLVTSVDQEGTGEGYDLELLSEITAKVKIPVIASGGFSTPSHAKAAILQGGVQAVAIAGALHFKEITIMEIKKQLLSAGLRVRVN